MKRWTDSASGRSGQERREGHQGECHGVLRWTSVSRALDMGAVAVGEAADGSSTTTGKVLLVAAMADGQPVWSYRVMLKTAALRATS